MGYTHYWEIHDEKKWAAAWPQLIKDASLIIELANIPLETGDGIPKPCTEEGIWLNGSEYGHEPFVLPKPGTGKSSDFCKTARKPYDLVVCTILMRAKLLAGDGFSFSSDGIWNDEEDGWVAARKLYSQLWPEDELTAGTLGPEEDMAEETG